MHTRLKREVYELLKIKGGYYLSPIEQANREYIFDIMTGSKKVRFLCYYIRAIFMKDLFITHVPHIKGLTVQEIIKEAKKHVEIKLYLTKIAKGKQPDRNFV